MAVHITLEVSEEDAERLRKALEDGELAYLGINGIEVKTATAEVPAKKWAGAESERRDASSQDSASKDDVPPRK